MRWRPGVAWLSLALSLGLWACAPSRTDTQIVVVVDSNLEAGRELTRLEVRVFDRGRFRDGEELRMQSLGLGPALGSRTVQALPLTFLLSPEQGESRRDFRLVVTGFGPGPTFHEEALVEQQVIAAFQPSQALRLDVYLSRTCLARLCRDGSRRTDATCERTLGRCDPVQAEVALARATDSASAGYAPACEVPPLCVGGQLRTCSADGTREQYGACPDDGDPCTTQVCPEGGSACVSLPARDPACGGDPGGPSLCGEADQPCCDPAGEPACRAGSCVEGVCRTCGGPGQPCCGDGRCGDDDVCNGEESCEAGVCRPGTPLRCSDDQGCTEDRCTRTGCEHQPLPNGSACDDADACTTGDVCVEGACTPGEARACAPPTPLCSDGECVPAPAEMCDGLDNDLDRTIDEGLVRACYQGPVATRGAGVCRDGQQTCAAGVFGACAGEVTPAMEVCNGADDDCDGSTDESTRNPCGGCTLLVAAPDGECGNGLPGACARKGKYVCDGTEAIACNAPPGTPEDERCNGVDDDCDARTDEEIAPVACFEDARGEPLAGKPGVGACREGVKRCSGGAPSTCDGAVGAAPEECGNEVDEDCDGERCQVHQAVLHARKVDHRAVLWKGLEELISDNEVCAGTDLACDLSAYVLARSGRAPDALRKVSFTLKLSNSDCSATEGEFFLTIDGKRHDLPSQMRTERVHCGWTHRVKFSVDFLDGSVTVDGTDRCLLDWVCVD